MYVLQLNPQHPRAWQFDVAWAGYWNGCAYVADPKKALRFRSRRAAAMAMRGIFVGLNGIMNIVKV